MPRSIAAIVVVLAFAVSPFTPALGQAPASAPAPTAVPAPTGTLSNDVVIAASPTTLWWALTTREGLETWMAPHVEVDLRVGGAIRSTYDPNGRIGDGSTIESTVLAFAPRRMLALKATRFPDGFPFTAQVAGTWAVMFLDPVDAAHTRVTIAGFGYADDAVSRQMMEFFKAGNQEVLDTLKFAMEGRDEGEVGAPRTAAVGGEVPAGAPATNVTPRPAAGAITRATLLPADRDRLGAIALLPGGEWRPQRDPRSKELPRELLGARQVSEFTLGGKGVRTRSFMADAHGSERQHSEAFVGFRTDLDELRFVALGADGTMQEGRIVVAAARTLDYPPRRVSVSGKDVEVREQLQFVDDDTLAWRAWQRDWPDAAAGQAPTAEPEWRMLLETIWKRTDVPAPPSAAP